VSPTGNPEVDYASRLSLPLKQGGPSFHREDDFVGTLGKRASGAAAWVAAALLLFAGPAWAHGFPAERETPPGALEKRVTKLGRGLANTALCWAEIPVTFDEHVNAGRPLAYLLGVSPLMGVARTVTRVGVGVFELLTFPVPSRGVGFDPLLEPAYLP
jgi:putative exosortase-associated protein (TIGR04073 family)